MFGFGKKEKKEKTSIKPLQTIETVAKLIQKSDEPIEGLLNGDILPEAKPIFELTFQDKDGVEIKATVSEFEFANVSVGDEGILTYHQYKYCNEIIQFADKIKPFLMDEEHELLDEDGQAC